LGGVIVTRYLGAPAPGADRRGTLVGGTRRSRTEEVAVSDEVGSDEVLKGIIGKSTGTSSASPIYHDPSAAKAAGFDAIPAPPTWPFVMEFSGRFPELQVGDTPSPHPLATVLGPLMASGALLLHGEQEFIYHRPVVVGDVLVGKGSIVDAYRKESKGKTMTFVVSETNWSDEATGEPVVTVRYNTICRA
jgi:hypothetical protein